MPLDLLKPYPRNPRTHPKRQIEQIANSLQRFGPTQAILIDENNQILCGHGRVEATKTLGWTEFPTVRIDYLSDEEKRAYIIADNKIALNAGWNLEFLQTELQGLTDLGCDIDLTGKRISGPKIGSLLLRTDRR